MEHPPQPSGDALPAGHDPTPVDITIFQLSIPPPPVVQNIAENQSHKSRLHEYAQRYTIPIPVYQTDQVGQLNGPPQFRSVVTVDGQKFSSSRTFSRIKEAEQDAARVAFEGIESLIKQEGFQLLHEDSKFSKSILNEFAAKIKEPLPTYEVIEMQRPSVMFIAKVKFHGETYTGGGARSKNEAEHVAARAAIESILGTSLGTTMLLIIKSKSKFFAMMHDRHKTTLSESKSPVEASVVGAVRHEPTALVFPSASQPAEDQEKKTGVEYTCGLGTSGNDPIDQNFVQNQASSSFTYPAAESLGKKRCNHKKKKGGDQVKKVRVEEQLGSKPSLSTPAA